MNNYNESYGKPDSNFVIYEIALKLKQLGFCEPCYKGYRIIHDGTPWLTSPSSAIQFKTQREVTLAPLWEQVINWLDSKGVYIVILPEFYNTGINWNVQINWYLPKEQWTGSVGFHIISGSFWFGDNAEYPTRLDAIKKGIELALEKLESK